MNLCPISRRTFIAGVVSTLSTAWIMRDTAWAQAGVALNVSYHPAYTRVHAMQLAKLPEEQGLRPNWIKFTAGPPTIYAFQAGSVDIGVLGIPPIMGGLAAGQHLKVIAIDSDYSKGEGLMARPDSGISELVDLKGKKVGTIKGTSAHYSLWAALKKANLTPEDVKILFLDGTTLIPAFTSNEIDAAWIFQPFWYLLADKGGKAIVTDQELGIPAIGLWIAREEWLQKNRTTCERFLIALEKAAEAKRANRDAVIQRLSSNVGLSPAVAERLYTGDTLVSLVDQTKETHPLSITAGPTKGLAAFLTTMGEFLTSQKIIPKLPDGAGAVDGSFALGAVKVLK